jgi:hypothetical protein
MHILIKYKTTVTPNRNILNIFQAFDYVLVIIGNDAIDYITTIKIYILHECMTITIAEL